MVGCPVPRPTPHFCRTQKDPQANTTADTYSLDEYKGMCKMLGGEVYKWAVMLL